MEENEYTSGFNQGYLIARHMPELAKQLSLIEHDSARIEGIKSGIEEFSKEQTKDTLPSWMRSDRFSSLDKDIDDKEKEDKDDPERE